MKSNKKIIYTLFILNTLIEFSLYISLVVLAVYLNKKVSLIETAIIIGFPNVMRIFSGALFNPFDRKFSQNKIMIFSLVLISCSYLGYILFHSFLVLLCMSFLSGLAQMLWTPVIKSAFSNCARNENDVSYVHRLRYISICIAGLAGPIFGNMISNYFGLTYCLSFTSIVAFTSIIIFTFNKSISGLEKKCFKDLENADGRVSPFKNRLFIMLVFSGVLIFIVFIQFESIYSLVLNKIFKNPVTIYSILLSLNSLFGILIQYILIKIEDKIKIKNITNIGIIFFQISYIIFGIAFIVLDFAFILLILGVFIYSIGEVLTIPGLDIQIDNIAPVDEKNVYFSIAEFRTLGFVIGPILTSSLLENFGAISTCISSVIILMIANIINFCSINMSKKNS